MCRHYMSFCGAQTLMLDAGTAQREVANGKRAYVSFADEHAHVIELVNQEHEVS